MKPKLLNILSGLALGALLGLIIGLSISEVVGIVLGGLTSLLVAFFGLKNEGASDQMSKILIAAFSVGCILFLFLGIFLRTRNLLAPSISYYKKELSELNVDSTEIRKIILLKKYGVAIASDDKPTVSYQDNAAVQGSLFSANVNSDERQDIVEKFQKLSYDSLTVFLKSNGLLFDQFVNSVETDISDTATRKSIFLQLIAITYKK